MRKKTPFYVSIFLSHDTSITLPIRLSHCLSNGSRHPFNYVEINILLRQLTEASASLSTEDERSAFIWSPARSALVFGMTVWLLVTVVGLMLVMQHYKQSRTQAEERIVQIVQQIKRAVGTVNAVQAEAMSATARDRLFLVTVTTPQRTEKMRPEDIPTQQWQRWLKAPKAFDDPQLIQYDDNYLFATSRTVTVDNVQVLVNVAQAKKKSLAAYYPVRNYAVGVWVIFTLGIMLATAILMQSLKRRQSAEQALRISEASLRTREANLLAVQSIARFASWRIDLETGAIHPSPEYLLLLEVTETTVPRTIEAWIQRFVPDDAEANIARQRFIDAHQPNFTYEGIRRVVLDSGNIKWIQFYARPIVDARGKHTGYLGVARDVTEAHLASAKLAESEERYRVISENMHDIVTLHSIDSKLLYASPSLTRLIGHRLERAIGNTPMAYIHADDISHTNAALEMLQNGRATSVKAEYRIRVEGGHYRWLETNFVAVKHGDGKLRHFQATSRDITSRKTAEQSLARRTEQLSVANHKLMREVERRQALERRVMLDIEMELAQVGLELHDELGQDLTGIALLTKTLERKLSDGQQKTAEDAARISELVNRAISHTRMISHGLSPYIWGESGLVLALAQLASDIDSLGVISCIAKLDESVVIEDEVVIRCLYRIAQEATNNALKHSEAKHIRIALKRLTSQIQLVIANDGVTRAIPANTKRSSNRLHSIRHRAQTIGAEVSVRKMASHGTVIRIIIDKSKLGLVIDAEPSDATDKFSTVLSRPQLSNSTISTIPHPTTTHFTYQGTT
jgi:PAS domain S-box-containing protein